MSMMKLLLAAGIVAPVVLYPPAGHAGAHTLYNNAALQPEYAKWGRVAMQAADERYDADIVDYAYEGRFPVGANTADYRFRLWLRKDNREFGVRVSVRVNMSTNEQMSLTMTELNG